MLADTDPPFDLAGTALRLVRTEIGLMLALVGSMVEVAGQGAHSGLAGEVERFDSAGCTDLDWKTENLGCGHHIGCVVAAGKSEYAAHTDHVVTEVATSGSVAHTGSVVRMRMVDSVVHTDQRHWGCMSVGQSPAGCC